MQFVLLKIDGSLNNSDIGCDKAMADAFKLAAQGEIKEDFKCSILTTVDMQSSWTFSPRQATYPPTGRLSDRLGVRIL